MRKAWRPGGHYHVTHTDLGALRWLSEDLGIKSLLDVGCGPGGQVRLARQFNMAAWGIDADKTLCDGDAVQYGKIGHVHASGEAAPRIYAEAIWSVEVAEHIDEHDAERYVHYMQACGSKMILMTANAGEGPYHCNPQPIAYWQDLMQRGNQWRYDEQATAAWKQHSTMTRDFVQKTGMVFTTCA